MKKTNVIYIVLDDMGFSDLGCFGAELDTPHIDVLAADGALYNNFTVCPASSPTRASLLTGRDCNAVGMGSISSMVLGPDRPDIQGRIRHDAGTVAQILRKEGYATCCVGKWHCAPAFHATSAGPFDYWPLNKGFDRFYGFLEGDADQYTPQLIQDNHFIDPPERPDYHLSEDLVDRSVEMISDVVSVYPEKPFFLYLCFGVAHAPHQVMKSYIDRYKGRYDVGWDILRQQRLERQIRLGIVPEGTVLPPKEADIPDWDSLSHEQKELFARFQETYAGFITHCDEQIGRLTDYLKRIGEYDNSLIVLLSDNGATRDGGPEGVEEFFRFLNGRSLPFRRLYERIDEIGSKEMKALYPKGWASVGNTPFREYKGTNYGGAVRTPLIIHWGNGIRCPGAVRSGFCNIQDVTPTVLSLLGITAPESLDGIRQIPMQGKDFSASFTDPDAIGGSQTKYYRWANSRAIYHKGWKALSLHSPGSDFSEDRWELFDLKADFSESTDLSSRYPEKLEELKALWEKEASGSTPLPMTEITAESRAFLPEGSPARKKSFRFVGQPRYWGCGADPVVENRPHRIDAAVTRRSPLDDGVLLATGGSTGGWTFYVKDNRLHYCFNNFLTFYSGSGSTELPTGQCTLSFRYEPTAYCAGEGVLSVNGQDCSRFYMETTPQLLNTEGMSMGRDSHSPVCPAYEGQFSFRGLIHEIRLFTEDPLYPHDPANALADDHPTL